MIIVLDIFKLPTKDIRNKISNVKLKYFYGIDEQFENCMKHIIKYFYCLCMPNDELGKVS